MDPPMRLCEEWILQLKNSGTLIFRALSIELEIILEKAKNAFIEKLRENIAHAIHNSVNLSDLSDSDCVICREPMGNETEHIIRDDHHWAVELTCGHVFGYSCLETWLWDNNKSNCPICRTRLVECVDEYEAWMSAFDDLIQKRSHLRLGELQMAVDMQGWFTVSTVQWVRELLEITSAFLVPSKVDTRQYRGKAKIVMRGLLREFTSQYPDEIVPERILQVAGLSTRDLKLGASNTGNQSAEPKEDLNIRLMRNIVEVVCEYTCRGHLSQIAPSGFEYWSNERIQRRIMEIPLRRWRQEIEAVIDTFHNAPIWGNANDRTGQLIARMRILLDGLSPKIYSKLKMEGEREDLMVVESGCRKMENILSSYVPENHF